MKQYTAGILAVIFMAASVGAPVAIYRCSIAGKYQMANCCAKTAHGTYGGSIKALPCMWAMYFSPMKANATPDFHKTFAVHIAVFCTISGDTVSAPPQFAKSHKQCVNEYLPPPLLLSTRLLV